MSTGTVMWVMVMFGSTGYSFDTGPEFRTQQSCELASITIWQAANERTEGYRPGREYLRKPFCVRIEK